MKTITKHINERLKINKDSKPSNHQEISISEFLNFLKDNDVDFDDSRGKQFYWDIYLKGSKYSTNYMSGHKAYVPSIYLTFQGDYWKNGSSINFKDHKKCVYVTTQYSIDGAIHVYSELKDADMYDESENYFKYTKHNAKELIRILKENKS